MSLVNVLLRERCLTVSVMYSVCHDISKNSSFSYSLFYPGIVHVDHECRRLIVVVLSFHTPKFT